MRRSDFAAAWAFSDTVLRARVREGVACHTWPRHEQFIWRGDPLDGRRVLVLCHHGLGDTIQLIRLVAPLRRRARHVTVWAQPALLPPRRTAAGVDRVLPLHDGCVDVDYDVDIEVMELGHALRIDGKTLSHGVPYLFPARGDVLPVHGGRRAVGIVWQAGEWDRRRSVPAEVMGRIGLVPGVDLYSLKLGPARPRAAAIGAIDISHEEIGLTAARLRQLDRVLTVDTMIAHLAGALGVRVWMLLPHTADWRWMRGERTPWYPSMRAVPATTTGRLGDGHRIGLRRTRPPSVARSRADAGPGGTNSAKRRLKSRNIGWSSTREREPP